MLQLMLTFACIWSAIKNEAEHSTYSVHAGQPGHNRHLGLLDNSLRPLGDAPMKMDRQIL
ncbi:hypothetical protein JY96_12680 [Aquabacterium sp. NJ1]|nr:hypothetical protein JY96_12680 [Aquabacterium sp. NJ1]